MSQQYVPPQYGEDRFNCPHCLAYTHQDWFEVTFTEEYKHEITADLRTLNRIILEPTLNDTTGTFHENGYLINNLSAMSKCFSCEKPSIWISGKLVYPQVTTSPPPTSDMPEDVKEIYNEARMLSSLSPRAAAALLRLALEKLLPQLGAPKGSIDKMIGHLVKEGLPEVIQKALDSIRVIGNEAVHAGAGSIDLRDDTKTVALLFKLLNIVVEEMITRKREIDELYDSLPQSKIEGIAKRDKNIPIP